jgi:MFS transporter, DHA1 family, multidrug resistance protein
MMLSLPASHPQQDYEVDENISSVHLLDGGEESDDSGDMEDYDGHRPCHLEITRSYTRPSQLNDGASRKKSVDSIVDFDGPDDPYHPTNWPTQKKVITTLLYGLVTMTATWASSSYSPGTQYIAREFQVGTQVATLGTSLFLLGFGIGPLIWAPLSEV